MENETSKDPEKREQAHKCALDPKRSNFQLKTFPFNEKGTFDSHRGREQAHKLSLNLEDWTFK